RRDAAGEQRVRDRLTTIAREREGLQQALAAEFPDYAALSRPAPLAAGEIQALLADDEALLLFWAAEKEIYVFALTRQASHWTRIPLGAKALAEKVAAFR